ncbi:MAG: hypothetical protein GX977_11995 [Firmicutes bacterium]|nr:hypothetical protein [Bacillota bacterium]
MSVKKKAYELAKAVAESPEYLRLKEAETVVNERQAARLMLQDTQEKQAKLREKYAAGEKITDAELEDLQKTMELVSFNPYIRELLEAEYAFTELMAEVWQIIGEAVGLDMPKAEGAQAQPESEPEPKVSEARSRLWVPGKNM